MLHKREMQLFPLSIVLENIAENVIDQLPAAHCLTGCDTVAKVGTKNAMMKVLMEEDQLLTNFGREQLDDDMISDAEKFLVRVLASKKAKECTTFDELRAKKYFHDKKKRIVDLPCTSQAIKQNIKRAFLQTKLSIDAPYLNQLDFLDPADYGFQLNLMMMSLDPIMFEGDQLPPDIPEPCYNCKTCAKKSCPCRIAGTGCTDFCGCADNDCKNPHNSVSN